MTITDAPTVRLTWKDATATLIVAVAAGLYGWHLAASDVTLIESTRWMGGILFVLGLTACMTGGQLLNSSSRYAKLMANGAGLALVLMIITCITANEAVLAALAGLIGVMWLVTTVRHAFGIRIDAGDAAVPDSTRELQHR